MASLQAMLVNYRNNNIFYGPMLMKPKITKMARKEILMGAKKEISVKPAADRGSRYSKPHKESLKAVLIEHPNELYPLLKLFIAMKKAELPMFAEPHWEFCYFMLHRLSSMSVLMIQQLDNIESRRATCLCYLILRALDTVEDDMSIPTDIKIPILKNFHRYIYDPNWHFSCGDHERKELMDNFHHLSTAFLELEQRQQEAIENVTMRMGAGMAKFYSKEVKTLDDYEEYCSCVGGLATLGWGKVIHASEPKFLFSDSVLILLGLLVQKSDVIKDFLEDINEIPKPSCHWPREIWRKYVNNLEDLKYEENSTKAIQCLNEMVTDALVHINDCLYYLSQMRDPTIFRFFAILQIFAIGELALCYNNIQLFRGELTLRPGLVAQIFDRTRTMADVYGAFYDFSTILRSKVDMNDPNAITTISRIEAVQKTCRDSGTLTKWKSYVVKKEPNYKRPLVTVSSFF
uniref:squalene synthase-like n=1 Tax=Erigeron canadensis TaxID=72917 RepID=UPI001CB90BD9|nr:squalene synthase-like [Erigeron canadensis]